LVHGSPKEESSKDRKFFVPNLDRRIFLGIVKILAEAYGFLPRLIQDGNDKGIGTIYEFQEEEEEG
jgi:hypothetical protein